MTLSKSTPNQIEEQDLPPIVHEQGEVTFDGKCYFARDIRLGEAIKDSDLIPIIQG